MWQHVKLSEQIRPRDTLACCWNVKQPTNKLQSFVTCITGVVCDPLQAVTVQSARIREESKKCQEMADAAQADLDQALPALNAAVEVKLS